MYVYIYRYVHTHTHVSWGPTEQPSGEKQDIELVVSVPPELLRQKLLGKVERKLDKQLEKVSSAPSSPNRGGFFLGIFWQQQSTI